tara:strand:+ start:379 stop:678 length:300 start_codon:yes stop_codon:yes gene_type:complete
MSKARMHMINLRKKNYGIPVQFTGYITHEDKINEEIFEESKEYDDDTILLTELLEELSIIKNKRTLGYFVSDMRNDINKLKPASKNTFLSSIQKKFYNK